MSNESLGGIGSSESQDFFVQSSVYTSLKSSLRKNDYLDFLKRIISK